MDETRFRLVVREVKALKGPCAAVTGIVEGGSISVDDYVCRNSAGGKTIRARVEGIMAASAPGASHRPAGESRVADAPGPRGEAAPKRRRSGAAHLRPPQAFHNHRGPHRDPQHPADRQSDQFCGLSGHGMEGQYIRASASFPDPCGHQYPHAFDRHRMGLSLQTALETKAAAERFGTRISGC